jgi:hypothetical protein
VDRDVKYDQVVHGGHVTSGYNSIIIKDYFIFVEFEFIWKLTFQEEFSELFMCLSS